MFSLPILQIYGTWEEIQAEMVIDGLSHKSVEKSGRTLRFQAETAIDSERKCRNRLSSFLLCNHQLAQRLTHNSHTINVRRRNDGGNKSAGSLETADSHSKVPRSCIFHDLNNKIIIK